MSLTCPKCGYTGDLAGFTVDREARAAFSQLLLAELHPKLYGLLLRYIGLFGHKSARISWTRINALLAELLPTITAQQLPDGTATTPDAWIRAIEKLLDGGASGTIELPLTTNTYLYSTVRTCVGDLQRAAASKAERTREDNRRAGRRDDAQDSAAIQQLGGSPFAAIEDPNAVRRRFLTNQIAGDQQVLEAARRINNPVVIEACEQRLTALRSELDALP